jgi:hypothetical protein
VNRKSAPIPEPIAQLQHQLDQFRGSQSGRTKLPEALWQAAVELARQYGVYPVAHPLRLDYTRLKKQLGGPQTRGQRKTTKPAFVELIAPGRTTPEECVIEFESSGAVARCESSGSPPHRQTGRTFCAPGETLSDDPDHRPDAGAGGHRAGRWA